MASVADTQVVAQVHDALHLCGFRHKTGKTHGEHRIIAEMRLERENRYEGAAGLMGCLISRLMRLVSAR